MSDPTYVQSEIKEKPEWDLAYVLSEIMNDNSPLGWSEYVYVAKLLLSEYEIKRKP